MITGLALHNRDSPICTDAKGKNPRYILSNAKVCSKKASYILGYAQNGTSVVIWIFTHLATLPIWHHYLWLEVAAKAKCSELPKLPLIYWLDSASRLHFNAELPKLLQFHVCVCTHPRTRTHFQCFMAQSYVYTILSCVLTYQNPFSLEPE